jgi:exonuclease III
MNTRGINNPKKYDKIKIMLSQLETKFDIIVFGETKLKPSFPSGIYNLNGYERYSCCRDAKNSGGGLMIFIKKDILVKEVVKESSTFEKIKLVLSLNKNDYKVLSYYRNPIQQSLEPFLKDVEEELLENVKNTIMIGDVNLDANADNKDSERYINLLKSYDMSVTNTIKTRNESGRIIDHCCINFVDMTTIKNYTINTRLSDHNVVLTELDLLDAIKHQEGKGRKHCGDGHH